MFEVIDASNAFQVTPDAIERVESILPDDSVLRVGIVPGGCSGFSYEIYFDQTVNDDDAIYEYGKVTVVVDPESLSMLKGATLDYKGGLQSMFTINNPNAARSCGCGKSFS